MGDRPMEGLPFDLGGYSKIQESVGTTVLIPENKDHEVLKVSKKEEVYQDLCTALRHVIEFRMREEVAKEVASTKTKEAIVPQEYVLADGDVKGTTRVVRVQRYTEGVPLKNLGYRGVLNLDDDSIDTLRSLMLDSMKCYLEYGVNYDLVGSDERDAARKSRLLNIKRLIFPLRNSSNLFKTNGGIKLIDPNVMGQPNGRFSLKSTILQGLLFASSLADYLILTGEKGIRKIRNTNKYSREETSS